MNKEKFIIQKTDGILVSVHRTRGADPKTFIAKLKEEFPLSTFTIADED